MTNAEIIQTIRNEIERRTKELDEQIVDIFDSKAVLRKDELQRLLSFLSTLESEKPMNPDELEKEIEKTWLEYECYNEDYDKVAEMRWNEFENVARHFYELGKNSVPIPEDIILFKSKELFPEARKIYLWGYEEGKRLIMEESVKWLVDDDYHELTEKGRFILGSVGIGYNGYYIPYSDLLKLPKEGEQ